ncbi:MAG: MFS transporter [bacterium]
MPNEKNPSELRTTIRVSTTEGVFAQIYTSIAGQGSIFITKFAVLLGATPFHFGVLSAIGQLSQVFQPLGVAITKNLTTRKGVVIRFISSGRALTLLFGLLPFIFPSQKAIWAFLFLFFISTSLQAVGANAWVAWIADMIPLRIRGRFWALRSQYLIIAGLLTGFIIGAIIDLFDEEPGFLARYILNFVGKLSIFTYRNISYAFLLVFIFSAFVGLLGLRILYRQPEHPKEIERESLNKMFFSPLSDKNFRHLILYSSWWMFAIGIGSPFWQPFMITKLKMPLVYIMIYGTISTIASILTLKPWGYLIDRFGNKTMMKFAIVLSAINPMVWLFANSNNYRFLYIEAFTSGVMWSGANIISVNLVLAIAPDDKKQVYSGLLGAFSGIAMVITMLLSGAFLPKPMNIVGLALEPEQVLFGLTGIVRLTSLIPLSLITEPKAAPIGVVLFYLSHNATIKMTQFVGWIFRFRKQD